MRSCLADFLAFLASSGRTPCSLADRLPPHRHVRHESEPHLWTRRRDPPGAGRDRPSVRHRQTRLRDDPRDRPPRACGSRICVNSSWATSTGGRRGSRSSSTRRVGRSACRCSTTSAGRSSTTSETAAPRRPARRCSSSTVTPSTRSGPPRRSPPGCRATRPRAGIEFPPGEVCGMHSLRGRAGRRDDRQRRVDTGGLGRVGTRLQRHDPGLLPALRRRTAAAVARSTSKTSSKRRPGRWARCLRRRCRHLVADLVALRHAGGYRFKVQERVLAQFGDHCRREGYPDGSITKEAVDGFLYGRSPAVLHDPAQRVGCCANSPSTPKASAGMPTPRSRQLGVRVRHQPPYVLTDDEVRRLFAAIDSQAMSSYSNKALVDPALFRVLYGAGLRVSEALN